MSKHTQEEYIKDCMILAKVLLDDNNNDPDKAKLELQEIISQQPYEKKGKDMISRCTSICIDFIIEKRAVKNIEN